MRENETERCLQAPMLTSSPPPPFVSCTNNNVTRLKERQEHNYFPPIARKRTAPLKQISVEMPHIEREALGEFFSGRNLLYNAEVHNDENHSESRDTNIDIK